MTKNTPTKNATKRAAAYARAAFLMESAKPTSLGFVTPCACCEAISEALRGDRYLEGADLESPLKEWFKPAEAFGYWWGDDCICRLPETLGPRVIALCFMAAMVEAGDA